MKKLIWLFLLLPTLAVAQGVRYGPANVLQQATVAGVPNTVVLASSPIIHVCNHPANAVPCTNYATTYTDATLGTVCSTATQIVLDGTTTCVGTPDQYTNWGVWVAAGNFDYTITLSNGASLGPYYISAGGSGGGGGGGVTSLNSLTGPLNLVAGANITVTPSGTNLNIAANNPGGGTINAPLVATSSTTSAFIVQGLPLGNGNADVTSCPYTVQADTTGPATTVDRGTVIEVNSASACAITLKDPSAPGMSAYFAFKMTNIGAGTVTVTRQTSATFTVAAGSSGSTLSTSFQLFQWQYATIHSDNANWHVEMNTGAAASQVWPSGPGIMVCTGTPCTAFGTSLSVPLISSKGGTGLDTSASTGLPGINSGTWAVTNGTANDVAAFGTGAPVDTSILYTNLVTQSSNGTNGYIAGYTGSNKALTATQSLGSGINAIVACTGGGSANAQTASCTPSHGSQPTGLISIVPTATNTSYTPTLAVDGLTAKTIVGPLNGSLRAGDIQLGTVAYFTYDGTYFELQNPQIAPALHNVVYQCTDSQGSQGNPQTAPTSGTALTITCTVPANRTVNGDVLEANWNGEVGTASDGTHNGAFDIRLFVDSTAVGDIGGSTWPSGTQTAFNCGTATVTNHSGTLLGGDQDRHFRFVLGGGGSTAMTAALYGSCIVGGFSGNFAAGDDNVPWDPTTSHTLTIKMHANAPTSSSVLSVAFNVKVTN